MISSAKICPTNSSCSIDRDLFFCFVKSLITFALTLFPDATTLPATSNEKSKAFPFKLSGEMSRNIFLSLMLISKVS